MTEGHRDVARAAQHHLEKWDLRIDGPTRETAGSLVVPVLTSEGAAAVLKIGRDGHGSDHEHLVLRRWGGDGAVRLLRADPPQHALLVERVHSRSLTSVSDTEACAIVSGLYRRLQVALMPQLRSVTSHVAQWASTLGELPRGAAIPHRLVEQVAALSRDLTTDTATDVVLHGNLHYGTVLAADRVPWLAISPHPVNGDPHYELAPMLWHRWDDLDGTIRSGIRDGVRRRFYALVDAAGLDEDRARAWTLIRVVHAWTRELADGHDPDATSLTRYAAITKAVQD